MTREYLVVYEYANGSYSGYAPDLPGCISAGGTHEEMRKNMRETVENHVGSLVAQGNPVPSLVTHTVHCPKPVEETDTQHWIIERMEIEIPVSGKAARELASA
jgi:predicted RNase H-like HicB family nuclease